MTIYSVLFLGVVDQSTAGDNSGVSKKISGQIKGLREHGVQVSYILRRDDGYWLADENGAVARLSNSAESYSYKIKNQISRSLAEHYRRRELPDLLFIRGTRLFGGCGELIRAMKKNGKKVVVEIPTVLRLIDQHEPRAFVTQVIDDLFLWVLARYIDAYVIESRETKLYGVRTIRIQNGIDAESVKMLAPVTHEGVHMLAVALMAPWHGYERIIEGLREYYAKAEQPRKVYLDLVGQGEETQRYKTLAEEYGLMEYVLFHGVKRGEELDAIYDRCDLGLGSFGMYKINLRSGNTLKLKEYCAKGMPFVYACYEEAFGKEPRFCLLVENDGTSVDIANVLAFYDGIRDDLDSVRTEMRKYAEQNLSWRKEMQHVLEEA